MITRAHGQILCLIKNFFECQKVPDKFGLADSIKGIAKLSLQRKMRFS